MKTILIVLVFATVISTLGCGVIGQTPGGAVSPSTAIYKNVVANSYDSHRTYDELIIDFPAGITTSKYRVLFDVNTEGIDPATLSESSLKKMDPEIQDQFNGVGKNEHNFIQYKDIVICFYHNGDRELVLPLSARPKFKIGKSPMLELPISKENLDSYLGKPERLLKRGELP